MTRLRRPSGKRHPLNGYGLILVIHGTGGIDIITTPSPEDGIISISTVTHRLFQFTVTNQGHYSAAAAG